MSAPIRLEKPNFRTAWLEGSGGILDPYWQRIFTRMTDVINAQAALIEQQETRIAALEQYNIDNP